MDECHAYFDVSNGKLHVKRVLDGEVVYGTTYTNSHYRNVDAGEFQPSCQSFEERNGSIWRVYLQC